jgi:hypothetical protein
LDGYRLYVKKGGISTMLGLQRSFEREYYDMIKSAFLKYVFQVWREREDGGEGMNGGREEEE